MGFGQIPRDDMTQCHQKHMSMDAIRTKIAATIETMNMNMCTGIQCTNLSLDPYRRISVTVKISSGMAGRTDITMSIRMSVP